MNGCRSFFLASYTVVLALGCGGDDGKASPRVAEEQSDGGTADAEDEDTPCSDATPRHPVGLIASPTSGIVATVTAADFDPPRKYQNDWTISLTDPSGAPLTQAHFSGVRTWMPVHAHDGGFTPTVTEDPTRPGSYELRNLYFTMTGPWQVQFAVGTGSGDVEPMAFDVCVGQ